MIVVLYLISVILLIVDFMSGNVDDNMYKYSLDDHSKY